MAKARCNTSSDHAISTQMHALRVKFRLFLDEHSDTTGVWQWHCCSCLALLNTGNCTDTSTKRWLRHTVALQPSLSTCASQSHHEPEAWSALFCHNCVKRQDKVVPTQLVACCHLLVQKIATVARMLMTVPP